MNVKEILAAVSAGEMTPEDAEKTLNSYGFSDIGCARLDTGRKARTGYSEVVFCSGKADDHLVRIFKELLARNGEVLGTRASEHQATVVQNAIPEIEYDPVSKLLRFEPKNKKRIGRIAVCTAGTADIPVAEEAAATAEFFGNNVDRIFDVGVSGLHRLISQSEVIREANCIVAVAGMEGALPSVIGGLVSNPVIAVPTSVGYGANLGGISALLTMINSCANGIAVVNIDNGYGAGYMASQINRLATGENHHE